MALIAGKFELVDDQPIYFETFASSPARFMKHDRAGISPAGDLKEERAKTGRGYLLAANQNSLARAGPKR